MFKLQSTFINTLVILLLNTFILNVNEKNKINVLNGITNNS